MFDPLTADDIQANRDVRQREIVPPERLARCHALVIGVGAIGRQVALQLATVGVPLLTLIDDDRVGVENLAPQGYWVEDLSQPKVRATATLCERINPQFQVRAFVDRFKRSIVRELGAAESHLVVFVCVDSILTRKLIWESLRNFAALLVDGRMSAEVLRILTSSQPASDQLYPTTLFDASEAFVGSCTAKSTIFTASIAAGLMVSQFSKWLRALPIEQDLALNLLATELTTISSAAAAV